jgi:2-phospho-L-lactate guanylyltransferase
VAIVPDRHGEGTNALVITPPGAFEPSFGPGSRLRHEAAARRKGIEHKVLDVPSLRLDVDTPEDLQELASALDRRHGAAALTRGALSQLGRTRPRTAVGARVNTFAA